ncbi:hypothetical protein KUL49_07440 [Alteromonas sp. KUL49]|nr:hypothetical protein KUL49_07440 [Alteromonas sp. KUL49]
MYKKPDATRLLKWKHELIQPIEKAAQRDLKDLAKQLFGWNITNERTIEFVGNNRLTHAQ